MLWPYERQPVRSLMFELKVMESGAFKFDAGMPENGCRTRRGEEAESFSKKLMKVTSVAWQPHAALHATLHATLPNCWQGQHYGALRLLRNKMKIQVNFSVLIPNAALGSVSAVLRVM